MQHCQFNNPKKAAKSANRTKDLSYPHNSTNEQANQVQENHLDNVKTVNDDERAVYEYMTQVTTGLMSTVK